MIRPTIRTHKYLAVLNVAIIVVALVCQGCVDKPSAVDNVSSVTYPQPEKPVDSKYLKAINLGGQWFLNNENSNFIGYEYDIKLKGYTDSQYPLRQMGALWAINTLYKFTNDERYKLLGEKGYNYFRQYFRYDIGNGFYYVNITPKDIRLGYSAFMILSLLEMDREGKDLDLERLANGIIYQQRPDGSLKTLFYSDLDSGVDYYPGEALLAMMAMYEYTKNERYLVVVEKALPYYVRYFRATRVPAFVPWQTRAYTKYVNATGNAGVAAYVLEMNDFIVEYFQPVDCANFKFSGISAAIYLESVVQAYSLAQKYGDARRLTCYRNFIDECAAYLLTLQLTDTQLLPGQALGGFLSSPSSAIIRCDNNQHALMGLMDAYRSGLIH